MEINISRRVFLQQLVRRMACLAILSPVTAFAKTHKYKGDTEDLLSFADMEGLGPETNAPLITREYVPLHKERELPAYMIDAEGHHYAEQLLRQMFVRQGLSWDKSDQFLWTYQHYGVCDDMRECYKLLGYCTSAQDFLYSNVRGLLDIDINWRVLSRDFMHILQNQDGFNGFTGQYTYLVYRISLLEQDGNLKTFGLTSAMPVNRAINFINAKGNTPDNSLMYIISGSTSLISPFSELLHITTHGPVKKLAAELRRVHGWQQAGLISEMVGETITASAATLIALEYMSKFDHGDRRAFVEAYANNLGSRFALIPQAIAYMQYRGIDQTLESFAEDPMRLMKEISEPH